MSLALGQPVTLSALVRDDDGIPANAGTSALTITLPDGTVATPVLAAPVVTGTYFYVYVPTVPGLHTVRWVFTGDNASAPPLDSFYVDPATLPPMISLAEARAQCRLASPADDPELQRFASIASDICERRTRFWRRQAVTAAFDGGRRFLRLRSPVLSVTTVTENGTALTSAGWVLDGDRGWLYRGTTTAPLCWAWGVQNVAVAYVAGAPDAIPESIRQGVRLQVQHMWDSQRGGSGLPRVSGADFVIDPRTGFTIPNAVLELWRAHLPQMVA